MLTFRPNHRTLELNRFVFPRSFRGVAALLLVGLLGFVGLGQASAAAKAKQSPMVLLKTTQQKLEKLLNKKIDKKDTKALEAREAKIKEILLPYFVYEKLAEHTLGSQWAKITKAQQASFTFWLQQLLELAYVQGARSNKKRDQANATIKYKKESVKGNKAKVFTKVRYLHVYKKRNRKRWKTVRVDWMFEKIDGMWKIMDIVTNDNSMMDTYKEQFEKIIKKKGFDNLQNRIKKKVNQMRKKRGLSPLKGPAAK